MGETATAAHYLSHNPPRVSSPAILGFQGEQEKGLFFLVAVEVCQKWFLLPWSHGSRQSECFAA